MTDPVIITGGSSGIGLGIARAIIDRGHPVLISSRDAYRCEIARRSLRERGGDVISLAVDTTNGPDVERLVSAALDRWGCVAGLVIAPVDWRQAPPWTSTLRPSSRSLT